MSELVFLEENSCLDRTWETGDKVLSFLTCICVQIAHEVTYRTHCSNCLSRDVIRTQDIVDILKNSRNILVHVQNSMNSSRKRNVHLRKVDRT